MNSQSAHRALGQQHPAGEIALAWIVWKYWRGHVDCNPGKLGSWLRRRSHGANVSEELLLLFTQCVILQAALHVPLAWSGDITLMKTFEEVALKLASFELYRPIGERDDATISFHSAHSTRFSMHEVVAFYEVYVVEPHDRRADAAASAAATAATAATAAQQK